MAKIIIAYHGEEFTIRSVFHQNGGHVNIGGFSLESKVIVDDDYPDSEAQAIDEQIYGYVDDAAIEQLSDVAFEKFVNKHID